MKQIKMDENFFKDLVINVDGTNMTYFEWLMMEDDLLDHIDKIGNETYEAYFDLPTMQQKVGIKFGIDKKDFEDESITMMGLKGPNQRKKYDGLDMESILHVNPIIKFMKKRGFFKSSPQNLPQDIQQEVDRLIRKYTNSSDENSTSTTFVMKSDDTTTWLKYIHKEDPRKNGFFEEMKKRCKTQNYVCIINFINSQMVIGKGNADILIVEIETKDCRRVKSFEKIGSAFVETNKFGNLNLLGGTLIK